MKVTDLHAAAWMYGRLTGLQEALKKMPGDDKMVTLHYARDDEILFTVDRGLLQELLEEEISTIQNEMKALGVKMEVEDAS